MREGDRKGIVIGRGSEAEAERSKDLDETIKHLRYLSRYLSRYSDCLITTNTSGFYLKHRRLRSDE